MWTGKQIRHIWKTKANPTIEPNNDGEPEIIQD